MSWKDWGFDTIEEFKEDVEKLLDSHLSLAQLFVDEITPNFSVDSLSDVQDHGLEPDEEWEQLLIYHSQDLASLNELTKTLGVDGTKTLWKKHKDCDKRMGQVMPHLYRVFLDLCDIRRSKMASGYYEKCKAEWTLPYNFDPKNPFPDIVYPEGVLD